MPFKKEKKPGKRDSLNKNKNNEQIQAQEGGERTVGRVSNAEMIELLSPGVNNNNSNEFDQRDSGPRADSPAKLEDIVREAVKGTETTKEKIRWLENSLGNIALLCEMLQKDYKKKGQKPMKRFSKKLAGALYKLERVRIKGTLQRSKEEIESSLDAIEDVLDTYEGLVSGTKDVKTLIIECRELLPIWAKWKDNGLAICLYVMQQEMETIGAETEIEQFKELSSKERRRQIGRLMQKLFEKVQVDDPYFSEIYEEVYKVLRWTHILGFQSTPRLNAALEKDRECAEFISEKLIPHYKKLKNRELIDRCEEIVKLLEADIDALERD